MLAGQEIAASSAEGRRWECAGPDWASTATASSLARSTPTAPCPDVGTDVGTGLAQAAASSAVDAVLASSRSVTAVTTWSLEPAANELEPAPARQQAPSAARSRHRRCAARWE